MGTRGLVTRPRWRVTKPLRDRIAAGHPWVYDRALEPPGTLAAGDIVTLVDERGSIATALAAPASPIRARNLDRDPDGRAAVRRRPRRGARAIRCSSAAPVADSCTAKPMGVPAS